MADITVSTDIDTFLQSADNAAARGSLELGGSEPTISVADAAAMQVIIDAGSVEVGQLFKLATDGTLRRFEGGSNSRIIEKYYNDNPAGYARFVTTKGANLTSVIVNSTGATGWCYSVDGGSPTGNYFAGSDSTGRTITIPAGAGVPHRVDIWPANDDTSGRVGDLTTLHCYNNNLTSLDVSGLTSLANLRCHYNNLTSLDVSGLTSLTTLYCYYNNLTSLDVSGLTALTYLNCQNNSLTSLDVSGLTALTYLSCQSNSLTSLDVSGLTALTYLYCNSNGLTSLDVSVLTSLTNLTCRYNSLTSLDVSGLTALIVLGCDNNDLTSLDVSGLTALTNLICHTNLLTNITAVGFDGSFQAGYHHHQGDYYSDFKNNQLTTDALYSTIDQMAVCNPATAFELDGNPCEINNVLQDGVTYTAAQLSALATSKSLTLILN